MTRPLRVTPAQARKLGVKTPRPPKRDRQTFDTRPGAWSRTRHDLAACGDCGGLEATLHRELARESDDGMWRCEGCFQGRRKGRA